MINFNARLKELYDLRRWIFYFLLFIQFLVPLTSYSQAWKEEFINSKKYRLLIEDYSYRIHTLTFIYDGFLYSYQDQIGQSSTWSHPFDDRECLYAFECDISRKIYLDGQNANSIKGTFPSILLESGLIALGDRFLDDLKKMFGYKYFENLQFGNTNEILTSSESILKGIGRLVYSMREICPLVKGSTVNCGEAQESINKNRVASIEEINRLLSYTKYEIAIAKKVLDIAKLIVVGDDTIKIRSTNIIDDSHNFYYKFYAERYYYPGSEIILCFNNIDLGSDFAETWVKSNADSIVTKWDPKHDRILSALSPGTQLGEIHYFQFDNKSLFEVNEKRKTDKNAALLSLTQNPRKEVIWLIHDDAVLYWSSFLNAFSIEEVDIILENADISMLISKLGIEIDFESDKLPGVDESWESIINKEGQFIASKKHKQYSNNHMKKM